MSLKEVSKSDETLGLHSEFKVMPLGSVRAREEAVRLMVKGCPIGSYNEGVCAIWGNGADSLFVNAVAQIKGEVRNRKPLAAALRARDLVPLLDKSKIPEDMHKIFLDIEEFSARLGALCFLRVPIREEVVSSLPSAMISRIEDGTPVMQNWDPYGHKYTQLLVDSMINAGIQYPAVTSMNISGQPEIVNQNEGEDFSRRHGIPRFLKNPDSKTIVQGSYTIFEVGHSGIRLIRDGNVPHHLFKSIFGYSYDIEGHAPSKYPQANFPEQLTEGLDPRKARIAILSYIHGHPLDRIRHHQLGLKQE